MARMEWSIAMMSHGVHGFQPRDWCTSSVCSKCLKMRSLLAGVRTYVSVADEKKKTIKRARKYSSSFGPSVAAVLAQAPHKSESQGSAHSQALCAMARKEFYWRFHDGSRGKKTKWSKFTEDGNAQMNAHINAPTDGPCAETFTMNHTYISPYSQGPKHTAYKIDLGKMEQTNPDSDMVREIEGYWKNDYNGLKFNWNDYQNAKTAKLSYPPPEAIEDQGYQCGQAASAAGLPSASGSQETADQNGQTESAQTSGSQPSGNLPSPPGLAREAVVHPAHGA